MESGEKEVKPNPNYKAASLDMSRFALHPSQDTPTAYSDINIYELSKILGENELYTLVQDVTMSPHIKPDGFKPSVKFVSWSPQVSPDFRSLLTVLTDAGGLNIYYRIRNEWTNIQSISNLWLEFCRKKWDPNENFFTSQEIMSKLKSRTYKIKINAFCWGEGDPEKNAAILFFITKDGTVVLLEIKGIESPFFESRLMAQFETNIVDVSSMTCFKITNYKFLIYFTAINGKIYGTTVEFSPKTDDLTDIMDETATFMSPFCVWSDEDRIQVSPGGMLMTEFSGRKFLIVAKGAHLIIFALNNDGSSFKHDVTSVEDIMITGLNLINYDEIIVTTRSAIFTSVKIDFCDNDFLKQTQIIENSLKNDYYACFGIALSPNKVMAYVTLSVKTAYDHLQLRECANTYWCAMSGFKDPSSLIDNYKGPTRHIWDALEISRIFHQKKIEPIKIHPFSDYDSMDIYMLQRQLWCINSILVTETSGTATAELIEHQEALISLIRLHSVQNWCSKILTSQLNEFTVKSLNAIMMWLSTLTLDPRFENMTEGVGQLNIILETSEIPKIKDSCDICGNGICEVKSDVVVCRNSHSIPICPISFVQVTDVDQYLCFICNAIFHKETVLIEKHCLFCDGVLRLNDLLLKDYEQPNQ